MVYINIMPGALFGHGISSLIGVNGMLTKETDIGFVQYHHFGWQQKNGVVIYFLMGIKTPAKNRVCKKQ
jgi:hypothetical protein